MGEEQGVFEGRLVQAGVPIGKHNIVYTREELEQAQLVGLSLYYEHKYELGPVGKIDRHWLDSDGWLNISGRIDISKEFGRRVYDAVRSGQMGALSLGMFHGVPGSTDNCRDVYKKIDEASFVANPLLKHALIRTVCSDDSNNTDLAIIPITHTTVPMSNSTPDKPTSPSQQPPVQSPPPQQQQQQQKQQQQQPAVPTPVPAKRKAEQQEAPTPAPADEDDFADPVEVAKKGKLDDAVLAAEKNLHWGQKLKQRALAAEQKIKSMEANMAEFERFKVEQQKQYVAKYAASRKAWEEVGKGNGDHENDLFVSGTEHLFNDSTMEPIAKGVAALIDKVVTQQQRIEELEEAGTRSGNAVSVLGKMASAKANQAAAPPQQQKQQAPPPPVAKPNPWSKIKGGQLVRTTASAVPSDVLGTDQINEMFPGANQLLEANPSLAQGWEHFSDIFTMTREARRDPNVASKLQQYRQTVNSVASSGSGGGSVNAQGIAIVRQKVPAFANK